MDSPDWQWAFTSLCVPHQRFAGSVRWALTATGIAVDGEPSEGTQGRPATVRRVRDRYGDSIRYWTEYYRVPAELVIATICTESLGDPDSERREPGFVSYAVSPHRVSMGLMQTLISTARSMLGKRPEITASWLREPDNSIQAGTAYIAHQRPSTGFDPPVVACAYNAGGVYRQNGEANRWKMRQYPIGTGAHADRFVLWFNDCFRMYERDGGAPSLSFFALMERAPASSEPWTAVEVSG